MEKMFFYTVLILVVSVFSAAEASWELPNTPLAALGDAGSLYLTEPGMVFHANNNDWIGLTDKLMTGSMALEFYAIPTNQENDGYEFSIHPRLLTPIVQTRFDQWPQLSPPPGVYADDLEVRSGYSHIEDFVKFEVSISADLYGHYNGDGFQRQAHTIIGSSTSQENYGAKFYSSYVSGAAGLGAFLNDDILVMGYFRKAAVVTDVMARLSLRHQFGSVQLGAQYEFAYQMHSNLYENDQLEDYRRSWGVSFKWGWYQMTYSYISAYLKYDKFGQYYIDPVIISYDF